MRGFCKTFCDPVNWTIAPKLICNPDHFTINILLQIGWDNITSHQQRNLRNFLKVYNLVDLYFLKENDDVVQDLETTVFQPRPIIRHSPDNIWVVFFESWGIDGFAAGTRQSWLSGSSN